MKRTASLLVLLALSTATTFAQDKTDYTLNDEHVHFRVPPNWTAVMEKSDGNPEAVAFQVPDPTAQGTDDSATVTVKSRLLKNAQQFEAVVLEERQHAREQAGHALDTSNTDGNINQYFVMRGKTRYLVRDSFHRAGGFAVSVRCQRPLLDKTPEEWNASFDRACADVVASLTP